MTCSEVALQLSGRAAQRPVLQGPDILDSTSQEVGLLGTFSVEIEIGDPMRERWVTMDALVDTGASITSMSGSVLRELGVEPVDSQRFRFAQGEVRTMPIGYTWLRFAGKEILTQVLFNEENSPALLGALALEGAYMGVNPVEQTLVPVDGLMMATGQV